MTSCNRHQTSGGLALLSPERDSGAPHPHAVGSRRRPGLSLVIPAYNEQHRLPRTLDAIGRYRRRFDGEFEVVVVDDGSVDETVILVKQRAVREPWLKVLERPHRGKGAAVRAGILAAQQPWVMLCDADFSMPVDELDRFLGRLEEGCQVAVGSRELPESRRYHEPVRRHVMSRAFNLLVRLLLVPGLNDTQCGFKGFQREVAHDLFSSQRLDGFSFDVEILFLARKRGYRIQEVPIHWYFDTDSRVRAVKDTATMACDLIRIRYRAWRGTYGQAAGAPTNVVDGASPQRGEVVGVVEPVLVESKTL